MNNIYVSEMPKCCEQCQINCSKKLKGKFSCLVTDCDGCIGGRHKNCPLKLLSDRLAEERKKVVQELREKLKADISIAEDYFAVVKILDQIER